jgi:hypothetical protein
MKKTILLISLIFVQILSSQTIEIGPTLGFQSSRIDDSDFFNDSPSIGKSLWRVCNGFQTIFYFKNPKLQESNAIFFNFNSMTLGARSENDLASYRISTNSYELGYRVEGIPNKTGRGYLDAGLGMNVFTDRENIYFGNNAPNVNFPNLNFGSIRLKEKEYKLVLGIGYDFHIHKNFNAFTEIKVGAGFTNINLDSSSLINTYIAINSGIRYIINFKDNK